MIEEEKATGELHPEPQKSAMNPPAVATESTSPSPLWWRVGRVAAPTLLVGGLAWFFFGPTVDLEPARRLVEAKNYPEAKVSLAPILVRDARNAEARAMMAEVLVNIDPPDPTESLKLLEGLTPRNPPEAANLQVLRGLAYRLLNQPAKAEAAWRDALKLDPFVAEAGWRLIDLLYTEGRDDELRALALRLHRREPDPTDRVRLLLEAMRPDAEPLAAAGVVATLKPMVENATDNRSAALAYYRALAKDGTGIDEALRGLRQLYEKFPTDKACLDGLLYGLIAAGDIDGLTKTLAALPSERVNDPRLAFARGWLAEAKKDDPTAIREYETVIADHPSDREALVRLRKAYLRQNKKVEADAIRAREMIFEAARVELRGIKGQELAVGRPGLFDEAMSRPSLGRVADVDLYKKLAVVREAMGHPDEAVAWYRLLLKEIPGDPESLEAVARLEKRPTKPSS